MHPLIHLFYIYHIVGLITKLLFYFILLSLHMLDIPRPNDLEQLSILVIQATNYAFGIPVEVLLVSYLIGGVDFDMQYICDLIERAWETVLRRGRDVLHELRLKKGWWRIRDAGDSQ